MITDPISDMLIRIKNAQTAGHKTVRLPYSKYKHEIARALERAGFVGEIERKGKRIKKTLIIELKYKEELPMIANVRLLSRPSQRVYSAYKELRRARAGGAILLSTPKGVLSRKEAQQEKVGGQLIVEVW